MAKIRTVKPDLFRHDALFDAEKTHQLPLRLAFIGLFTCCDREGRFRWRPKQLKLDIFPFDDLDMGAVLDALARHRFIEKYEHRGEMYGCVPSWHHHQCINHREAESHLPARAGRAMGLSENGPCAQSTTHAPEKDSTAQACLGTPRKAMHSDADTPIDGPENTTSLPALKMDISAENPLKRPVFSQEITCTPAVSQACLGTPVGKWKGNGSGSGTGTGSGKEVEKEKEGEVEMNTVASLTRTTLDREGTVFIFSHWKKTMGHPHAQLDEKRRALIRKAIRLGYSTTQLCQAIEGCAQTPHNVGVNEKGQRYDGLHVILRDADQIDRFIHHFHNPPRVPNEANTRLQTNMATGQHWLHRKQTEDISHETH